MPMINVQSYILTYINSIIKENHIVFEKIYKLYCAYTMSLKIVWEI